ncbi:MAG: hypothetical protein WBM02_01985 [bacterium]
MDTELTPQTRSTMTSRLIIALPFVLVALLAGYVWAEWKRKPSRPDYVTWTENQSAFSRVERELSLVYVSVNGQWVTESRTIRGFETERQEIQSCLETFLAGPNSLEARLPGRESIQVGGVYLDGKGGIIINFETQSDVLNMGGIEAEYSFIQSLIQTIKANYPSIKMMQLMVNGSIVETLAGHFDIRGSFYL